MQDNDKKNVFIEASDSTRLVPEPTVSVLMLTYNHESYLAKAIESVLQQTTKYRFELIIGEDCSTDKTRRIALEYQRRHPETIRVIYSESNVGAYSNGARLNQCSRGRYVAFCEGDDYWTSSTKLEKQVELLEANPDCCMCAAKSEIRQTVDGVDTYIKTLEGLPQERITLLDFHEKTYLHTSTYVIRRSALGEAFKWADRIKMSDTSLRYILTDMSPCIFLAEVVSVYRITGSRIWTMLNESEKRSQHLELYESLYEHFEKRYRRIFAERLCEFYYSQLIHPGKSKEVVVALKRIATLSAFHPQVILPNLTEVGRRVARKIRKHLRSMQPQGA